MEKTEKSDQNDLFIWNTVIHRRMFVQLLAKSNGKQKQFGAGIALIHVLLATLTISQVRGWHFLALLF